MEEWEEFTSFCKSYLSAEDANLPVSINSLSFFLAFLFSKGYAPATFSSYNSAISYVHKLNNVQDPASSFFISKLLHGARKKRNHIDSRLPITKSILHRLVMALDHTCYNPYYQKLYKSMFVVAFHAFLRVGVQMFRWTQIDLSSLSGFSGLLSIQYKGESIR